MCFNYYPSRYRSLEASLGTNASRSIAGPIVFSLHTNKPVTLSQIGYTLVLLYLVCLSGGLYLEFCVWNGQVTLVEIEPMFVSLLLQDNTIPVSAQLLVIIAIAVRLSLLLFVFKPVS